MHGKRRGRENTEGEIEARDGVDCWWVRILKCEKRDLAGGEE